MIRTEIAGTYFRVADADWADPLDSNFAQASGGRWNAPNAHQVLYLNANDQTARANVRAKFEGLSYGPEDLDPADAPRLVDVDIPHGEACELRTDEGLSQLGHPSTYPLAVDGSIVPWATCQPIGAQVHEAGLDGIACRSAAPGGHEELAWFPQPGRPDVSAGTRREFPDWYWGTRPSP